MATLEKLKKLKPVLVEWHDILDGGAEWHDEGDMDPVHVFTLGFLLSNNPNKTVIVRDYYDHESKRTYGGRLAIPAGCVW